MENREEPTYKIGQQIDDKDRKRSTISKYNLIFDVRLLTKKPSKGCTYAI